MTRHPCQAWWATSLLLLALCSVATDASSATLCGTIRDATTSQPLARAACFLFDDQGQYTGLYSGSALDGSYCIDNVVAGTYTLQVRHDDYETMVVEGIVVQDTATGVDVVLDGRLLLRAWPNPSTARMSIRWRASAGASATLEVFDLHGRRLRGWTANGTSEARDLVWDLRDFRGHPVANGNYLLRLRGARGEITRHIAIVR